MNVNHDRKYLIYRVIDGVNGETHIAIDLGAAFSSIANMSSMFVSMAGRIPAAMNSRALETRVQLEDEAVVLLEHFALSEAVDTWEDDRGLGAEYDITDYLTMKPFNPDSEVALLTGLDLMRLDILQDVWEYPYGVQLIYRATLSGDDAYISPSVLASMSDDGKKLRELTSGGGRVPWSYLNRAITGFMARSS